MLDATEPETAPDDRPFTPADGVDRAHALELRAESMLHYAARGAVRTGALDRTEVGLSDENRDVVAGRDDVEVDGVLDEHTGDDLSVVADEVEMNVGGRLTMHAHLEDNVIMAGVMRDEWAGGAFVTAAMSDDMAAVAGLRCTAPLDVWVHGLAGMEERPGTCAADGLLFELAGTLYEREYGPSAHVAAVARHSGTVATTMKTGFRPLMKTALGVRNLIPGGGGGGGAQASASPPAAPPAPAGGEAGTATLTAAEGAGALGRGVAGGDDTDEIVSVVRTVESASDAADVEDLQHPASTADNLDDLARVEVDGAGYEEVAEIYDQPLPASGRSGPEGDELSALGDEGRSLPDSSDLDGTGTPPLAGSDDPPPLAPERPGADPSPRADSPAQGPARREPPPLDLTEPGAEGYRFDDAYGSLHDRNRYYRQEMNLRGNLFTREYLVEIDERAVELFTNLGGDADDLTYDNFGLRTSSAYDNLEQMALEADEAGNAGRAADIRAAKAEIEEMTNTTIVELAARTDEFSGAAIGSQRAPIDPGIDVDKLRGWLEERELQARVKFAELMASGDPHAAELAGWERAYYDQMIRMLDENVNPLAYSNEQIVFVKINKVDPYYAEFADDVAAAAAEGWDLVVPRPKAEDELDLYVELQKLLVATLEDPEFWRSAEDMGVDAFTPPVRARIEAGLDFLGPDSLRPLAGADVPPPLPAADLADSAGSAGEIRDRSFSRSALAASEETLERQAAGLAEGDATVRGRAPDPGLVFAEPSLGARRAPAENARAPVIDERSGRWVVEPPADGASPPSSAVAWDSGLRVPDDPGVGAPNRTSFEADTSDLFRAAPEPEEMDPDDVDAARHAPNVRGDGAPGPSPRSDGTNGEDANPTGAVSAPGDSTTAFRRGSGAGLDPSGPTSLVTPDTPHQVFTGVSRHAPDTGAGPAGASSSDAREGATAARSDLYGEPVSFEGRSLEGVPRSDDPKELARTLDAAEVPVEDLPRVERAAGEPAEKSILESSEGRPVSYSYADVPDTEIHRRFVQAQDSRRMVNDSTIDAGSVWRSALWSAERMDVAALREANARWAEFTAARRTSAVSFGDDPRRLHPVEPDAAVDSGRRRTSVDLYRGAEPPNTVDRAHAAHYVPRPAGRETTRETGFGRLSQGWNEFPFSPREQLMNTLQRGEALSPGQIGALESGLEGYRRAGGALSSTQYRAMADMIADLGDRHRHARWHGGREHIGRLLRLIEMLDYAAWTV